MSFLFDLLYQKNNYSFNFHINYPHYLLTQEAVLCLLSEKQQNLSSLVLFFPVYKFYISVIQKKKNNNSSEMAHKQPESDFIAKVIIIGDSGVGKTNLLTKFCDGVFKDSYVATIGVDFKLKTVNLDQSKVKLQIWDTAGQERFRNITQTYYKGAAGIILAYAINNKQTFKSIGSWIKQIEGNTNENVSKILIALKADLQDQREVESEQGKKLAEKHKMLFLEVSAKSGNNVHETFVELTRQIKNIRTTFPLEQDTFNLRALKGELQDSKAPCKC